MSRLSDKVKVAVLAALFAGSSFSTTLAQQAAPTPTAPPQTSSPSNMAKMTASNVKLQEAMTQMQEAQKNQDFAKYNEALAKAELALNEMETSNRAMDLELRDRLQSTLDDIDKRRGVSSKDGGMIGKLKEVQRKTEAQANGTGAKTPEGRRTEGGTVTQVDPRSAEQAERMRRLEEAEKKESGGGWKDTLGGIWNGAKAVFNGVRGAADVITGINNMRIGINKLREFGKNQNGFIDKAVDVAAGISGLGDGFDRTQRGVSRLTEAYQHFAGPKVQPTVTKL